MGSRSHTTFAKRQKELARAEKRRDKAAKKLQRKAEKQALAANPNNEIDELAVAPVLPEDLPTEH